MPSSTYPSRQPATTAEIEAAMAGSFERDFDRIFGAAAEPPRAARIRVHVKPKDGHRRTVTPASMADWMRDHPDANTREAMLVAFTEAELRAHFAEAKDIYSRTMADA